MMADGMKKGEIFRGPPARSALCSRSMVCEPADAGADEDADVGRVVGRDAQARVVHRELRRRYGELNEDVHLLDVFLLDEVQRVESLDLRGNLRRVPGDVELGDTRDPRCPGQQLPARSPPVPMPSDDTSPMPVMTTRLFTPCPYFFPLACASM